MPEALARELCLTGRMLDAAEALERGVVAEVRPVAEVVPRARELARSIAAKPQEALIEVKRRILLAADHLRGPLFADEERMFRAALLGDDPDPAA
jgi:enoyl-CoA hydratase/carnithine racemase